MLAGDLVLIPGDLSMARNHRDLQPDLAWLDRLPGIKVVSPGNHDQWWNGAARNPPDAPRDAAGRRRRRPGLRGSGRLRGVGRAAG